eukprot:Sspe_Gene.53790::Locus_29701_Transcript_1_1_Confidence_1.000_Length_627::g.53790::m.53790
MRGRRHANPASPLYEAQRALDWGPPRRTSTATAKGDEVALQSVAERNRSFIAAKRSYIAYLAGLAKGSRDVDLSVLSQPPPPPFEPSLVSPVRSPRAEECPIAHLRTSQYSQPPQHHNTPPFLAPPPPHRTPPPHYTPPPPHQPSPPLLTPHPLGPTMPETHPVTPPPPPP